MGTIVSNIYDEIKLHGSYEAYVKFRDMDLKKVAPLPDQGDIPYFPDPEEIPFNSEKSNGNEVTSFHFGEIELLDCRKPKRINPRTVNKIKQIADIVEVVGDFVSLKKKGVNYTASCPFHNEKSKSFNVNPVLHIYKCFGCGASGDAIKFVMDIEGIGYGEALHYVANKYNIEIQYL